MGREFINTMQEEVEQASYMGKLPGRLPTQNNDYVTGAVKSRVINAIHEMERDPAISDLKQNGEVVIIGVF